MRVQDMQEPALLMAMTGGKCPVCGKVMLQVAISRGLRSVDSELPESATHCINKRHGPLQIWPCPRALAAKKLLDKVMKAAGL